MAEQERDENGRFAGGGGGAASKSGAPKAGAVQAWTQRTDLAQMSGKATIAAAKVEAGTGTHTEAADAHKAAAEAHRNDVYGSVSKERQHRTLEKWHRKMAKNRGE